MVIVISREKKKTNHYKTKKETNRPGMRLVGAVATWRNRALFYLALHVLWFFFLPPPPPLKFFSRIFLFLLIQYLLLKNIFSTKTWKNVTLNLSGISCFKQLLPFINSINTTSGKKHYWTFKSHFLVNDIEAQMVLSVHTKSETIFFEHLLNEVQIKNLESFEE